MTALAMILLFALADRLAGGDYFRGWPIRAVAISYGLLATVLGLVHGPWALLAVAAAAWRWDGWGVLGGKIDPRTPRELLGYFLRHLFAVGLVPVGLWLGWGWFLPAVAVVTFAVIATLLGRVLAFYADRGRDVNTWIELGRGASYGALIGALACR